MGKSAKSAKAGESAKAGKLAKAAKAKSGTKAKTGTKPGKDSDAIPTPARARLILLDETGRVLLDGGDGTSRGGRTDDSIRELLRVREGFSLAELDASSTPGFDGDAGEARKRTDEIGPELSDLQERLYAEAKGGGGRSLLLVVQGMDTSGKGGVMRHVVGLMDPQGVDIMAFKVPTPQERSHPFLWRIRRALPKPGQVMVFDRSQYEDVLVVRVHNLVPASTWARRYGQINAFEATTVSRGTAIVKVLLHITKEEQGQRLAARLDRPDKHWKYNPRDVDERAVWADYQAAYQAVLDKTATDVAPWYVVPANKKWYARLAVAEILLEVLREMDPQWPAATFDVEAERRRLADS